VDARRRRRFREPSAVGTSLFVKSKPRTLGLGDAASDMYECKESNRKENRRIGAMIEGPKSRNVGGAKQGPSGMRYRQWATEEKSKREI